ncbi:hypothetical protein GQ457_08G009800 [Hibiscus cannabinus]
MEPKKDIYTPKERTNEVVTLELESDDNINATILSLSLVGKVISERAMKFSTVCAVLNRAWPIKGNFESHDLGKNFVLFVFNSEKEKQDVLIQGPWSVQDKHIVLRDWPKEANLEEIDFSLSEFWVHIYSLPMALINEKNAQKIGSIFPKYIVSNINDGECVKWDGFLKIKVVMRVDDPLKTGFKLKRGENDHIMVSFKYERMPEFCYSCGRMGHPAKECGYKDLNQKKGNLYGPWLRAPYSKKFVTSPTSQQRLQNSGATMENAKAPRRRVENLAIEECKIIVPATSIYEVEQKMSEQMTNKVETSFASGELYNSRQNQKILDASLNGFCPTLINSCNENIEALCKPKATLSISFTQEVYQNIQNLNPLSSEETRATYEVSNPMPPKFIFNPWNAESISKSLSAMDISIFNKRKREPMEPIMSNKRALKDDILKEVFEIEPGLWKSSGEGLIENEEVVKLIFSPGSCDGPSKIISKIEKKFKGKANGSRRLSAIKQAAREKHVQEIERKLDDETGLIEFGRDPFGKRIINTPIFESSPSLTLTEINEIQCDEDAKFFLFADDILECHSQEK